MAVFSNLEGTLKKTFQIGKNGGVLVYSNGALKAMNSRQNDLIPISVANPTDGTHAVNLAYFNSHVGTGSGGGTGNSTVLSGTADPLPSLGDDSNLYFKVDNTSIVQIFFKDLGVWKPYSVPAQPDSNYVTEYDIAPNAWTSVQGKYRYVLTEAVHNRGEDIIVQIQDNNGAISAAHIIVNSVGDITITEDQLPLGAYRLIIIGKTTLSKPYAKVINKLDWVLQNGMYTMSIPAITHNQPQGPLFVCTFQNTVDAPVSTSPFEMVMVDTLIDMTGNVTLRSNIQFSGKAVISGK